MKAKMIRDRSGVAYEALVTLTDQERSIVLAAAVPLIYAPGGMGPDMPRDSAVVRFGGACFTNIEANLTASLEAFRLALKDEIKAQAVRKAKLKELIALQEAEDAGRDAFPGGRFADAIRGTKSFPDRPKCPYKCPDRAAAWARGYAYAHSVTMDSLAA